MWFFFQGLKKPYNPILGEKFRCFWRKNDDDDDDDSAQGRTFYVAEQVSHHPPVSAFFASNSLSAILIGNAKICLLNRGETYTVNLPYAHCK
uniref:Oxysterol-binding protein n=1 Tax=Romanomermis culicivorax TaxID=13658 RepID=A0A915L8A8_ROMCU